MTTPIADRQCARVPNPHPMDAGESLSLAAVDGAVGDPTFTLAELVAIDKQRVNGGVR